MRFQTPSRPSTFTTHHLLKQRYSQLTFAAKPQSEQQHLLAALSLSLSLSLSSRDDDDGTAHMEVGQAKPIVQASKQPTRLP